jgi:hypothetical protein
LASRDTAASSRLTSDEAVRHLEAMREILEAVHQDRIPEPCWVVLPYGLDRSVLTELPFRVRTWNCLRAAGLFGGYDAITAERLLRIRNFGQLSIRDLVLVIERFLSECISIGSSKTVRDIDNADGTLYTPEPDSEAAILQERYSPSPWDRVVPLLDRLLMSAAEFRNAVSLAEVFSADTMQLASLLGVGDDLRAIGIEDLVDQSDRLSSIILRRANRMYATMSEAQRTVANLRVIGPERQTLNEVAQELKLTRERVRQIQVKVERKIDEGLGSELDRMAAVVKYQLGPIVRASEIDDRVEELLPDSGDNGAHSVVLARNRLKVKLGYARTISGISLDQTMVSVVERIKDTAVSIADDAGIIDEKGIMADPLSAEWLDRWPLLLECCGFHEISGSLALRNTAKARVKAAIIAAGSPVTREELAERCELSAAHAGSVLSSLSSVVRADKSRWGLSEWIEDEYEGIAAEIIQRIEEDGGVTTTDRLFDELPGKFGVSPASIYTYLQTPKFAVDNGHVSLADVSSVRLKALDDVIDGRDERHAPYWSFVVHQRHLEGHSLAGVPPELAKYVGCAPDADTQVHVISPAGCGALSVRWRLASISGATIGYLAEPLQRLGAQPGQRVRLAITRPDAVELTTDRSAPRDSIEPAESVISRMKRRRKAI